MPSFIPLPPESHFPVENLPYGVFRRKGGSALESLFPLLREINDVSFDLASRKRFEALCAAFGLARTWQLCQP